MFILFNIQFGKTSKFLNYINAYNVMRMYPGVYNFMLRSSKRLLRKTYYLYPHLTCLNSNFTNFQRLSFAYSWLLIAK